MNLVPLLRILETVEKNEDAYTIACEWGLYWICKMKDLGTPLLNHLGITQQYVPVSPPRFPVSSPKIYAYEEVSNSTSTTLKESLTIRDVVRELDVNEQTIRRWIRNGELHTTRDIVGRYRISRADLEDFRRRRMEKFSGNDGAE